jgi:hypothetical protein
MGETSPPTSDALQDALLSKTVPLDTKASQEQDSRDLTKFTFFMNCEDLRIGRIGQRRIAMRGSQRSLLIAALVWLLPSVVFAQASLTGTVRDASGSVLPGVTVEAASPALIEKTRTVVTDGNGVYRIIELNPGTYSVTYTLPGFGTVKRDGIQLAGTQVITLPIVLTLGNLQETITVTGETPVVDVQSVRREVVLDSETIQTIPATRAVGSLLNAMPGVTVDNNGLAATPTMTFFSARGGATNEGRMAVNGMTVAAAFNGGGVSSYILDSVNVDEVSLTVSGGLGESDTGGPVMNLVPRSGGNSFRGQAFVNNAGEWSKGNNLDDELRAANINEPPGIISAYDASVSYGGPIMRRRSMAWSRMRMPSTRRAGTGHRTTASPVDSSRGAQCTSVAPPHRRRRSTDSRSATSIRCAARARR